MWTIWRFRSPDLSSERLLFTIWVCEAKVGLSDFPLLTSSLVASAGVPQISVALAARVSSVDVALLPDLPAAAPKLVSG